MHKCPSHSTWLTNIMVLLASSLTLSAKGNEGREIRTPNLLIWSQTRCRCAIPPMPWTAHPSTCEDCSYSSPPHSCPSSLIFPFPCCTRGLLLATSLIKSVPRSIGHPQQGFETSSSDTQLPPWPNGQGVGLLIRRLRVRVPQGVLCLCP